MAAENDHPLDPVLWLGADRGSALRALMAAQFQLVEPLAARGIDRFSIVAENAQCSLALQLALDRPEAVTAIVLLAPTLITPNGQAGSVADEALVARLSALVPPLLAVFGTNDTRAPPEAGRHYRERLASCNVIFVYDAGAAMGDERPEAVAALVGDFLRRRDLFLVRETSDLLYP